MTQNYRVNDKIRFSPVRLIDAEGEMVGVLDIQTAKEMARSAGLDLVEISPTANPPVCKILDFGKFLYDQKKREKDQAKKNREHRVEVKELWLRPVTDVHDLEVKVKKAKKFLSNGDKVKFTVKFRGREMAKTELGADLLASVLTLVGDDITVEQSPKQVGRQMTLLIAPK